MDIKMPMEISCEELLSNYCTYCGWLRKEPMIKYFAWPKTYCVLHDRCFYYFKNESSKSPSGKFPLYGYNKVKRHVSESAKWSFILEHVQANQKSYIFAASSQQEMVEWMKYFKQEMLRANNRGQRTTADGSSDESGVFYKQDSIEKIEETVYDDLKYFKPVVYQNDDCHDSDLDTDDSETEKQKRKPKEKLTKSNVRIKVLPSQFQSKTKFLYGNEFSRASTMPHLPKRSPAEGQPNSKCLGYERVEIVGVPQASVPAIPKKISEEDYWNAIYYNGDKDEATRKIEEIAKDGVYLVRDSDDSDAPKVLVTYSKSEERAKKFKIFMKEVNSNPMYYLKKDLMFESIEKLIYYHYYNGISANANFKLTEPYLLCKR